MPSTHEQYYKQIAKEVTITFVMDLFLLKVEVGQYYYYVLGLIKYSIYKKRLANKYITESANC